MIGETELKSLRRVSDAHENNNTPSLVTPKFERKIACVMSLTFKLSSSTKILEFYQQDNMDASSRNILKNAGILFTVAPTLSAPSFLLLIFIMGYIRESITDTQIISQFSRSKTSGAPCNVLKQVLQHKNKRVRDLNNFKTRFILWLM